MKKSVGVITNHCRAHSLTTQKGQFCTVFKLNIFFILKICNKIAADVRVVNNDTNIEYETVLACLSGAQICSYFEPRKGKKIS